MEKAYLLLEDGTVFEGKSFGARGTVVAPVVFTTSVVGFGEILTDPSYFDRNVVLTFPLVDNAGIVQEDLESGDACVRALVVREVCEYPSNFRCERTLSSFLAEKGVVGLCGVDTRSVTRYIRDHGEMGSVITTEDVGAKKEELLGQLRAYTPRSYMQASGRAGEKVEYHAQAGAKRVLCVDLGCKNSQLDLLTRQGFAVTLMGAEMAVQHAKACAPDGIIVTDGADYTERDVALVRELTALHMPVFAFGKGHELLAQAMGCTLAPMRHGHRGDSVPVRDLTAGRTYVTSQNHGRTVEPGEGAKPLFVHAGDGSCEGLQYGETAFSVAFLPSKTGGPNDTAFLYRKFADWMEK